MARICRPVSIPVPFRHSTADGAAGSLASPVTKEYCKAGAFGAAGAVMVTATPAGTLEEFGRTRRPIRGAEPQQHLVYASIHEHRQVDAEAVGQAERSRRLHPIPAVCVALQFDEGETIGVRRGEAGLQALRADDIAAPEILLLIGQVKERIAGWASISQAADRKADPKDFRRRSQSAGRPRTPRHGPWSNRRRHPMSLGHQE